MKRILFLILFLANQKLQSQGFNGIAYCGINQSRNGYAHWGFHKAGITLGAGAEWLFSSRLSSQVEIQFDQKGFIERKQDAYYDLGINYLQVPVLMSYYFKRNVHASIGVSFGQLISYKEEFSPSFKSRLPLSRKDSGYVLGLGYFLSPHFQLKVFYTQSLHDINIPNNTYSNPFENSLISLRLICHIKKNKLIAESDLE